MRILPFNTNLKLIVTIVKKGDATKVLQATKLAGAEGGTILLGRGTISKKGILKFFQVEDMDQKEIILTLIDSTLSDKTLEMITKIGKLEKPGSGIAFLLDPTKTIGICHFNDQPSNKA